MSEMSPGTALRQLQQAQAGLKKARQVLRLAKSDPNASDRILEAGWESLGQAHRLLAAIPLAAADEAVMTKQLAVQRYATALLVRLRRLVPQRFPGRRRGRSRRRRGRFLKTPFSEHVSCPGRARPLSPTVRRPTGPRPVTAAEPPARTCRPSPSSRSRGQPPVHLRKMVIGPVGRVRPCRR